MKMRILVVGADGQLARSLVAAACVGSVKVTAVGRPELDLLNKETIAPVIKGYSPDLIVNAAAYTEVDRAEADEEAAFAVNAEGPHALAIVAAKEGIPLLHVSTDYVFDGDGTQPYVETAPVAPRSIYGRSKLAGEQLVLQTQPQSLIVRTSWVISPYGKNFCKTCLLYTSPSPRDA